VPGLRPEAARVLISRTAFLGLCPLRASRGTRPSGVPFPRATGDFDDNRSVGVCSDRTPSNSLRAGAYKFGACRDVKGRFGKIVERVSGDELRGAHCLQSTIWFYKARVGAVFLSESDRTR